MGTLRLYLALSVFLSYFDITSSAVFPFNATAVCCFYIISGFYMHLVITEKYGISRGGLRKFYINRALRLYPVYIAVLLLWHVAWLFELEWAETPFAGIAGSLNQILLLPAVLWSQPGTHNPLLVGLTYTIGIEMTFYLVAPLLVVCRLRQLAIVWACALATFLAPAALDLPRLPWQYVFIPGVFVFFVTGCLSYRFWSVVRDRQWTARLALPFAIAIPLYAFLTDNRDTHDWARNFPVFMLYALIALAIPFLFQATKNSWLDRAIGDLSYPLYVVQSFAVMLVIGGSEPVDVFSRFAATASAMLFAAALAFGLERPIDAWRARLARRWSKLQPEAEEARLAGP